MLMNLNAENENETSFDKRQAIAYHVSQILKLVGEDPSREGLLDTPMRVAKMYEEVLDGMSADPRSVLGTTFSETADGPVLVRNVTFYSLCEHHMVPFFGEAHVAYLPSNRIVGISKIARLVEAFGQRLQVQERLTQQIVDAMDEVLAPRGVIALVDAEHTCMCARGVRKPGSRTTTLAARGVYKEDAQLRSEFLQMLRG